MMGQQNRATEARAFQMQALLHEMEELMLVLPPEAVADILAAQHGDATADPFSLAREWLDAVRIAQAHRRTSPARPFVPRRLQMAPWDGPERRHQRHHVADHAALADMSPGTEAAEAAVRYSPDSGEPESPETREPVPE